MRGRVSLWSVIFPDISFTILTHSGLIPAELFDEPVLIRTPENISHFLRIAEFRKEEERAALFRHVHRKKTEKRVFNLTAYYERNGFEARVSQRRRSDFIGEIGNFAGNRTLRYVVGEDITDAQLSYAFGEDSAAHGLTVLLQASNLTNSGYETYAGTRDRPLEYIKWGRTLLLGASYKL